MKKKKMRQTNLSKARFRPTKSRDAGISVPIGAPSRYEPAVDWTPKDDSVEAFLDEMALRHAVEVADALTDEEQADALANSEALDDLNLPN